MEVEIQLQQVFEDVSRDPPDSLLRNTRKDSIAQLLKHRRANPRQTVRENGRCSDRHRSATNSSSSVNVHGIDDSLEIERNLDIEDLHANYQRGFYEHYGLQDCHEPLRLQAVLH
jgi:hypothetical protein